MSINANNAALNEILEAINELPSSKEEQEKIVDIAKNGTTEVTPDEGMSLSKVTVNVDVPTGGGDDLPDWDDDSPIIASGNGYYNSTIWEVTEKGTMRWRMNPEGTGSGTYYNAAGWGNSISISSQRHALVAPKIKQLDIGEGIKKIWLGFMPNCKRIRAAEKLENFTISNFYTLPNIDGVEYQKIRLSLCECIEKIELPSAITILESYGFSQNNALKELNLDNIISFSHSCLLSTPLLAMDIVFNKNLQSIGVQAFANSGIKSLTFQNSLDSLPTITTNSFSGCASLLNIYVPWSEGAVANAPWGATNATIHYNTTYDENGSPIVTEE